MEAISRSNNWKEFISHVESLGKKDKGDSFELLTKLYFQIHEPLADLYPEVWLWKEVPEQVREEIGLTSNDLGIDLLSKAEDGYHAIQCKYHSDPNKSITFKEVATFLTLFESNPKITQGYICTTADLQSRNLKKVRSKDIQLIQSDVWEGLNEDFFEKARKKLAGQRIKLSPYQPRTHQKKALRQAKKHFIDNGESRGKLIFPCGSGKSLTGYWITDKLESKSTIIAVPSLALVKQTLEVYLREVTARNRKVKWLCICSDEGIGKGDDVVTYTENIGVPCVTDHEYIEKWLKKYKEDEIFIFTTYQSGRLIGEVSKKLDFTFDLGIYDEAHKTVGAKDKLFSYLLFDENIDVRKRVFMTATERFYGGRKDDILSMDDTSIYGDVFAHMSFKEAIKSDPSLLTDYKVITLQVTDEEIADFIKENGLVQLNDKWKQESEARSLASMIALRKAMSRYPIRNAVSFHSSIEKAKRNKDIHTHLTKHYQYPPIETFTVSGKLPTTKRTKIVREFADSEKALITNARCLTEGVDVPNIDCIVFADPKRSKIDIVQALGRALRKKEGKEWGYVVLPVIFDEETKEVDNKSFNDILAVVRALAANDERIVEYLRDKESQNESKGGQNDQFDFEVITDAINEEKLKEELEIKLWNNIAKLNWRPFVEAREYVRSLNLANNQEWRLYSKSGKRPLDIPGAPEKSYSEDWISWGNWLGTGTISRQKVKYRPFKEARKFAKSLNISSQEKWRYYSQNKDMPSDIPANPQVVYKNEGWKGYGDWLGTGIVATRKRKYKPFNEARKFARSLRLKSNKEWRMFCKSNELPKDIPRKPERVYAKDGWVGWGDWLGTGRKGKLIYQEFEEACHFVQILGLKSQNEWNKYCQSGDKPSDIPGHPQIIYKDKGWNGWGDWLGTGNVAPRNFVYRPFLEARNFARNLGLKSQTEWRKYLKDKNKPVDIPANPDVVYKDKGWKGYGDWLGTGRIATRDIEYLSYEKAKEIVHSMMLSNSKEYKRLWKSGELPNDLPSTPERIYKHEGWNGWADWIGPNYDSNRKTKYREFNQARSFARSLELTSSSKWIKFWNENEKPTDIPLKPDKIYKDNGWQSWGDWLGTGRVQTQQKNFLQFEEARSYIHSLKLKSVAEFRSLRTGGIIPDFIPSNPHKVYKNEGWVNWRDWIGK